MSGKKVYRKRRLTDDSSGSDTDDKVSKIKSEQNLRCRRGGINAVSLAVGRIVSEEEILSGNVMKKICQSNQVIGLTN